MKLVSSFIACILITAALVAAPTQCLNLYPDNEAPDILNPKLTLSTQELCYSSFAVVHSGVSRTPLWSAEHLTREGLRHKSKRTNDFHPEEQLEPQVRSELVDYARSGYDRGHMAPAADMPNNASQHECFTLANMVPQNSENNRGIWSSIEGATRHLTNQKGELYVITGPIFSGTNVTRIGGRVLVPTQLYKAIFDPSTAEGAAYLVNNTATNDYQVISIAQLERISGIRIFPHMSPSAKQNTMTLPNPQERNNQHYHNLSDKEILQIFKKILNWIF